MTDPRYPLREHAADDLQAASGRPFTRIATDAIDDMRIDDLQISPTTLRAQAEVARSAGYTQLAANLLRAAELTAVPNDVMLQMYEMQRPERSSHAELLALAERLERQYDAPHTAGLVREAAGAYGRTTAPGGHPGRPTNDHRPPTTDQRPTETDH